MKATYHIRIIITALFFVFITDHIYSQAVNDNCANAVPLSTSTTCSAISGDLEAATSTGSPNAICAGATSPTNDVWYSFTATSSNATITVSGLGTNLSAATTYIELLSGTCGSFTSIACQTVATSMVRTTLTPGTVYYVRVYVTGATSTGGAANKRGFSICLVSSPNDEPVSGVSLTPGTNCTNTSGTLLLSTVTSGLPVGCEAAGNHWDVWYKFTAINTISTITISTLGANFTNPEIQLYSGTPGSLTSMQCGTTTITNSSLTVGTTYYVRVSNISVSAPSGTVTFNICITYPPTNDDCANAINLYSNTTCSNTSATLASATASSGVPLGCAAAGTYYDVWFTFTAASAVNETITLSSLTGISAQRIQIYNGSCGSLSSVACSSTSTLSVSGLSVGTTYYVRVSNYNAAATSTGNFDICITHPAPVVASVDYGKSYINVSKNSGGGTINPGDTLEIRATLVIRSGSLDSLAFLDTLHLGGGVRLVPGSIALRTNEGKVYKSFTDAVSDDEGYYYTSGTDTVIRINFGATASTTKRGLLSSTSKPSVFGSTMIIMATYRVVVYAGYNSTLSLGGGKITAKNVSTGILSDLSFSARSAAVYSSPGLCPNSVSASNAIGGDFNGTFGTGTAQNRGASANVTGYTYSTFQTSNPQDYYYGIANNTSTGGSSFSTVTTWAKPDNSSPTHRVFNLWDITGDHTGATNTTKGNRPCDPNQPISATNPCGYMLIVNSAYKTDTAFQYTISNLCPNTYYEISSWIKNICYKCGCDSNGVASTGSGYIPSAPNDSSGVQPNITFDIDGVDYYTTGNIQYGGLAPSTQTGSDSNNVWVKRGFTYKTGSGQSSLTLTIRNNAPGGGGNDWALDDIALKTCSPDVTVTPGPNPFVCDSNTVDMGATIASYFNTYTYYTWEYSIDNGATWLSTGKSGGPVSPTYSGGVWSYSVAYPTFIAYADSLYRVMVASTPTNLLNSSCRFSGGATIALDVDPCDFLLDVSILSFKGRNENNKGVLYWTTSKEEEPVKYEIQKSKRGSSFVTIGEITGYKDPSAETNHYTFVDPELLDNTLSWYRIKEIKTQTTKSKYSKVVQLIGDKAGLQIESLVNPFNSNVKFDLISGDDGLVQVEILDQYQHKLKGESYNLVKGRNSINIDNTDKLPAGFYILRVTSNNNVINRKIIKRG
ncbi:MAG TPA: T9SS type A sorting domain-containing protein [Chitinophagaceae bacterium]|nr:T9SS type A sorting domain-containing protein [Chitinophagaceae bacterium]